MHLFFFLATGQIWWENARERVDAHKGADNLCFVCNKGQSAPSLCLSVALPVPIILSTSYFPSSALRIHPCLILKS